MPKIDPFFMKRAIKLGKRAFKKTGDNPWVGCVIVKNNKIIGEGHTQPGGTPHAEAFPQPTELVHVRKSVLRSVLHHPVDGCGWRVELLSGSPHGAVRGGLRHD